MGGAFFTIGHSNRSLEEFLALLEESAVELVVDVRRLPGSSKHPQFDEDALGGSLDTAEVELVPSPALTGRRPVSRTAPFEVNAWWQNRSFHNYADHALSDEFADALDELRAWGSEKRVAVMCAEAVWWRCHRRIIADHLLAHGESVQHIMGAEKTMDAKLSDGARVGEDGRVTYPATAQG
ncbi:DUF488 domain-containing protein [Brevibacterium yomogidense]|uniref:DUF488 domain-containing protein n=1 Tax=Brevibacterium yomogidense TaxID=946573 RepID=A0A1X6XJ34_9MICO|nr:DUF488 domain-containing protein [Brevibacterium yomogidense]SLM99304.1 protein of unknown function DUF1130 [Brevibacterium yomogidense]